MQPALKNQSLRQTGMLADCRKWW